MTLTVGSLFSGVGGLDLGLERAGMSVRFQVEIDPYCRRVLAKHWPNVERFDDVRLVGAHNLARVDVVCGGFPCQDISNAGRRAGIDGARSGLWSEFARIIRELRPRLVLVENVAALLVRGIDRVLGDLAESGYDAEWDCIPACAFGAPHSRERLFLVANTDAIGRRSWRNRVSDAPRCGHWETTKNQRNWRDVERWLRSSFRDCYGTATTSELKRVDEWFPERLDRLRGLGNAVVPQVAEWIGRRIVEAIEAEGGR